MHRLRVRPAFRPDAIDLQLIEQLEKDARMPLAKMGRMVGLSQPATSERVRRLEDLGVIKGYSARIDAAALGLSLRVVMRIRVKFGGVQACLVHLRVMPEVVEIHRLTGEDCLQVVLLASDPEMLEPLIDDVSRFGEVATSIVVSSDPPRSLIKNVQRVYRP